MTKKIDKTEEKIIAPVEEVLGKTEQFIENNQKIIGIVVGVVIVLVLGYFGFKKYYLANRQKEAQSQMFMAEKYFEIDSLNLAINGDGSYPGFIDIIDEYGWTKSANLAHYYLGICYLKKGEFENAIDELEKFDGGGQIMSSMATGAIGDAYMELGETKKAIDYYQKAADQNPNEFVTPVFLKKVGMTYEILGNYADAIRIYERIKKEYYKSFEARDIDKYIARVEGLLRKN